LAGSSKYPNAVDQLMTRSNRPRVQGSWRMSPATYSTLTPAAAPEVVATGHPPVARTRRRRRRNQSAPVAVPTCDRGCDEDQGSSDRAKADCLKGQARLRLNTRSGHWRRGVKAERLGHMTPAENFKVNRVPAEYPGDAAAPAYPSHRRVPALTEFSAGNPAYKCTRSSVRLRARLDGIPAGRRKILETPHRVVIKHVLDVRNHHIVRSFHGYGPGTRATAHQLAHGSQKPPCSPPRLTALGSSPAAWHLAYVFGTLSARGPGLTGRPAARRQSGRPRPG
jgi:hypothetical protein